MRNINAKAICMI